jgi:hypothetical protein
MHVIVPNIAIIRGLKLQKIWHQMATKTGEWLRGNTVKETSAIS